MPANSKNFRSRRQKEILRTFLTIKTERSAKYEQKNWKTRAILANNSFSTHKLTHFFLFQNMRRDEKNRSHFILARSIEFRKKLLSFQFFFSPQLLEETRSKFFATPLKIGQRREAGPKKPENLFFGAFSTLVFALYFRHTAPKFVEFSTN